MNYLINRDFYADRDDYLAIKGYVQAISDNPQKFASKWMNGKLIDNLMSLCSRFSINFPFVNNELEGEILMTENMEKVIDRKYPTRYGFREVSDDLARY